MSRQPLTPLNGTYTLNGMSNTDSTPRVSFRSRIAALEIGETASETRRLALGFTNAEEMRETHEKLRNLANTSVHDSKGKTGGQYTVESGDFRTKSYDIIAVVAVTRTR